MVIDFLIGFLAVNSLPHYLFGRMKIGVLSLFGYSSIGNLCYSFLCLGIAAGLFAYKYGFGTLPEHMFLCGVLSVVFSYMLVWDLVNRYLRQDSKS